MLSAHNLAANAVGTDLVRLARSALRSVPPSRWGAPFIGAPGSFWVRLIGHPQAENEEAGWFTSCRQAVTGRAPSRGARLDRPGNRHVCKFASGFGISKKLKA
jgi:hypothetical protein